MNSCSHFYALLEPTQRSFKTKESWLSTFFFQKYIPEKEGQAEWRYAATLTGGVRTQTLPHSCPNVLELAFATSSVATESEYIDFTYVQACILFAEELQYEYHRHSLISLRFNPSSPFFMFVLLCFVLSSCETAGSCGSVTWAEGHRLRRV